MQLFIRPGACSLAAHIALREIGRTFELKRVGKDGRIDGNGPYVAVANKGYVPALRLDDGTLLTEAAAVLQYIADQRPDKQLAPANGSLQRYQLQEWLNFLSSEVHKQFSVLFNPRAQGDWRQAATEALTKRLLYTQHALGEQTYLMGANYNVADIYLFVMLRWAEPLKVSLDPYPTLSQHMARVAERGAVKEALLAEGLR